jgi:metal-responsive CopG/Arc/MetJ family transcriptional regulator
MNKEYTRIQMDVNKDFLEELERIKEQTGATTRTQVIRECIRFYRNLLKATEKGESLFIEDKNGIKTRIMII